MRLLLIPLLALPLALFGQDDSATPAVTDRAEVKLAITDYVQAFYEAKPELIERSVSKDLKKMGYWKTPTDADYGDPLYLSFEEAKGLAERWNGQGQQGEDLEFEIEIHEVLDKVASGKLVAKWGIDYFHLSKIEGKWMIQHVLWQSHPESK